MTTSQAPQPVGLRIVEEVENGVTWYCIKVGNYEFFRGRVYVEVEREGDKLLEKWESEMLGLD